MSKSVIGCKYTYNMAVYQTFSLLFSKKVSFYVITSAINDSFACKSLWRKNETYQTALSRFYGVNALRFPGETVAVSPLYAV